jgi:hypothetical protein
MTRYRYPPKAVIGDYLRAAGGFAVTGGPALFLPTAMPVTVILGVLAALFGIFGLRTALRQFTYYSTRRDGQGGWMQMKISGPGGHIRVDSALDGFARLAGETATSASAHGVTMTGTTLGNFKALGVAAAPDGTEAGA